MIREYNIISKEQLNHNTFIMVISPLNGTVTPTIVSSFYFIYTDDKVTKKPYTPIASSPSTLTFAIKTYLNGNVSQYISKKQVNTLLYLSDSIMKQKYERNKYRDVLMIAGGTGITPMLQILMEKDNTNFILIFCNLTRDDIFMKDLLDEYKNLQVKHCIESEDGRITKDFIENAVVIEGELLVDYCYVCGPKEFVEVVCGGKNIDGVSGYLKEIGFTKDQVYKF